MELDVFKLTLPSTGQFFFRSAVACGGRVDISVQKSFVVSVDDGFNIEHTTIRNFEGFSVEYFTVGVVVAKVLIYESDEFGTDFGLDGLAELGIVVGTFSSSILFVVNWCRLVLESVIIICIL